MEKNLLQITAELRKKGFNNDFMVTKNNELKLAGSDQTFKPSDLKIIDSYRLEGNSNPSDMVAIFGLQSISKPEIRGIFIEPFGASMTGEDAAVSQKLVKEERAFGLVY